MNYQKDKEVLELVQHSKEKGFNLSEDSFVSKFDFGSTYQGTDDKFSDRDVCYLYITDLEEFLYKPQKPNSKHFDDLDARVMPLHQMYFFIKKHSVDSYLILNAQLENGSAELNEKVFSHFYDKTKYNRLVESNLLKTVGSLTGNLNTINKRVKNQGLTGKNMNKFLSFLEVFHRIENGNVTYKTLSKASEELSKDVVPLKRYEESELREFDFNKVEYFNNKSIGNFNDLNEYVEHEFNRLLELKKKIEKDDKYNGVNYSEEELLEPLKENILGLYKEYYKNL